MDTQTIRERLEVLVDTSRGQTLAELKAIKHIGVDPERNLVVLLLTIGELGGEAEKKLRLQIAKIIKIELKFSGLKIEFEEDKKIVGQQTKFILVASGKGGVGKSFVAANLAVALARRGIKTGLIDADIYGASIPDLLEMPILPIELTNNEKIIPFKHQNIEVISTEFFSERDKPILWRGDQLQDILNSFFYQVQWDPNLEYIIVDCPTGTGDVMLDLKKMIPNATVLLVTTPDILDCHIVTKTGLGYLELNHRILGVIENKAHDDSEVNEASYASEVANQLGVEVFASIPYKKPQHNYAIYEEGEDNAKVFEDLAVLLLIQ